VGRRREPAQHIGRAGRRVRLQHSGQRGELGGDVVEGTLGDLQGDERLHGKRPCRVDAAIPDQVDQLGQETAHWGGSTVQVDAAV
jgi:hypothetical protein